MLTEKEYIELMDKIWSPKDWSEEEIREEDEAFEKELQEWLEDEDDLLDELEGTEEEED